MVWRGPIKIRLVNDIPGDTCHRLTGELAAVAPRVYNPFYGKRHTRRQDARNVAVGRACSIRGALDAPKYKDYILPLIFVKRLSDVFADEIARLAEEFDDEQKARSLAKKDHSLVRFYIPPTGTWAAIRESATQVGERVTDAEPDILGRARKRRPRRPALATLQAGVQSRHLRYRQDERDHPRYRRRDRDRRHPA